VLNPAWVRQTIAVTIHSDFFSPPTPRVIAHRGGAGTAPENTLAAFDSAYAAGMRYFEFDLHATCDGTLVVCHDPDLARTTDRAGRIQELTFQQVSAADAGYWFAQDKGFPFRGHGLRIPRLAEILERYDDARYVIEIKQVTPSIVPQLDRHLTQYNLRGKVLIASEHQQPLDEVRRRAPDLPTNFSANEVRGFLAALTQGAPVSLPGQALQIPPRYGQIELATATTIAAAHRLGVEVHVWTVNEPAEMSSLLALGVDAIITDYPERLTALLLARQA
jgi:glycerophosphoryl diester phosphodiesterase